MAGERQYNKFCIDPNKDECMKQKSVSIIIGMAVLVFLLLSGRYGFTVVKMEDENKAIQNEAFSSVAYVDGIWDSQLIPTFQSKAVELTKVLSEMEPDADGTVPKDELIAIANHYGLITVGEAHAYMIKGSGKIVGVNTETSLGTAEVKLDGYDGPVKVLLYIGTRIPSDDASVRDSVGFISFGDFKEQTEYGKAASEINKRVISTVLSGIDKNDLTGKTISFMGAFNIRTFNLIQIDVNEIRIVPVDIELGE
jgi:predicted lipoprotein